MPPRKWTDEQLREAVPECSGWAEVAELLGLSVAGGTLQRLRTRAAELGLDTSAWRRSVYGPSSKVEMIPPDEFARMVAESRTWAELAERLGYSGLMSAKRAAEPVIQNRGLSVEHFAGHGRPNAQSSEEERKAYFIKTWLREGVLLGGDQVWKLVVYGLLEWRCQECGLTEWRGKGGGQAPLQLDHIDGDRTNNLLENLRFLCANCHMQTETWGNKGNRRRTWDPTEFGIVVPKRIGRQQRDEGPSEKSQ